MRTAIDYSIGTKTARLKLDPRPKPYYRQLGRGLTLGYVRVDAGPGRWVMRELVSYNKYRTRVIADADDLIAADGLKVQSYEQAAASATKFAKTRARTGTLTVKEACDRYIEALSARSRHADEAKACLAKHVIPSLGDRQLASLTTAELEKWRSKLIRRDDKDRDVERRSKDTVNRIMSYVKAAFNAAFQDEVNGIPSDGAWRRLKRFKNVSRPREHDFSEAQVRRLIKHAPDLAFKTLLTAGFLTGARYGELAALDVRDVDTQRGLLHVRMGKTGPRTVILQDEARRFFGKLAKGRGSDEPLLTRADASRWGKSHQHRPMKAALRASELPPKASFYTLRHSFISRCIEGGVPITMIAENVGTSVRMIEVTYAKIIVEKRRHHIEGGVPRLSTGKTRGAR